MRTLYPAFIVLSFLVLSCNTDKNPAWSAYLVETATGRMQKDSQLLADGVLNHAGLQQNGPLKYYEPDSDFIIRARLKRIPPVRIAFRTNTDRNPAYYTFAVLEFRIGDTACSLMAYAHDESGDNGLFVPFRDRSNGKETYGAGRYIDLPYNGEQEFIILDFNKSYNPYCHYNDSYSCPLVPEENRLPAGIYAGEKAWHP